MGDRMVGETIVLTCDMVENCEEPITHIDNKGYIYCQKHGNERKSVTRCRRLTGPELMRLQRGQQVERY